MRVLPGTDFEWDGREGKIVYRYNLQYDLEETLRYLTMCVTNAGGDLRTAMWESTPMRTNRECKIEVAYLFKKDDAPKEPVYRHECPKCHHRY